MVRPSFAPASHAVVTHYFDSGANLTHLKGIKVADRFERLWRKAGMPFVHHSFDKIACFIKGHAVPIGFQPHCFVKKLVHLVICNRGPRSEMRLELNSVTAGVTPQV